MIGTGNKKNHGFANQDQMKLPFFPMFFFVFSRGWLPFDASAQTPWVPFV